MWYNDAEQYVLWVIIIACGWFSVLKLNKAKQHWRTAEGYLNLPLGVLEKQLHELWGLPI